MDWQTHRNQFMRTIGGDPPGAQLEAELIAAYTNNPESVERSLEKIALAFKAGKIRSPWGALKTEVAKAVDQANNPTHDKGTSKVKAIARAEQWVRNAGLHYDSEAELLDELFGDRGMLKAHRTEKVRARILEVWHEVRPTGVQLEHEHEARMAAYARQTAPKPQNGPSPNHPTPKTAEPVREALA